MAKKIAKLKKLVPASLLKQLASAKPGERKTVLDEIERSREKNLRKMEEKGYTLEAVIADRYGVFTRAAAVGTVHLVEPSTESKGRPKKRGRRSRGQSEQASTPGSRRE